MRLLTFSKWVAAEDFLAVGDLNDLQHFSRSHRQILPPWLCNHAVRIHHHGVQRREWPLILRAQSHKS